ncbi:bile acid:Na+ symporter, BASS family [Nitrosospira multiformis]|uniref:Bile acid:Na+ symporter, BASS family n=1 Tax=Nitrosospira multiformis TaxID=1231 RepID=A0A1I7H7F6_9PROT|nr:bile acid:Na+ symporter, BASS family [Nitrosospira multiformis]
MLAALLFNAGLGMKIKEVRNLLKTPLVLLGGVFGNLTVPLTFIIALSFAMKLWHNPEEAQLILVGLAFVAAMPIAGFSTAWTQNANGNLALSLGLVLLTTLLSPLLSPLVLHAVGFMATGDYSEDLHELAFGVGDPKVVRAVGPEGFFSRDLYLSLLLWVPRIPPRFQNRSRNSRTGAQRWRVQKGSRPL